jgi:hypothetical protein
MGRVHRKGTLEMVRSRQPRLEALAAFAIVFEHLLIGAAYTKTGRSRR